MNIPLQYILFTASLIFLVLSLIYSYQVIAQETLPTTGAAVPPKSFQEEPKLQIIHQGNLEYWCNSTTCQLADPTV